MSGKTLITTVGVALMVLLFALDLTVVATALPTITSQFHDEALYGWVFSAYSIPVTTTTLLYGRMTDIIGRRRLFIIAVLGFLAGSILCGLAQSMLQLVIFRAVQGVFAGAIFPLAIGTIADIFPIEKRAQGFAIVPTMYALAAILGPTAGGFLTDTIGWRWIFFLNVPVVILAMTAFLTSYRPAPRPAGAPRPRLRDLDFSGFVAFASGIVALLLALTLGGQQLAWTAPAELLLLVDVVAAFAVFFWCERRARIPLLPLRILRHRGLGGAVFSILLLALITNTMIVLIPSFAQGVLGATARGAGLVLIPMMLVWSVSANVSVRLGQRFGFRAMAIPGAVALALGLIFLGTVWMGSPQAALLLPMAFIGLGAGFINPNMMVLAQNSVSDREQGLAGGLGNFGLNLGAALAAPILVSLEVSRLAGHGGGAVGDPSTLLTAAGRSSLTTTFGSAAVTQFQRALDAAMHDVFLFAMVPLGILLLWLVVVVPTNSVARRIRLAPLGMGAPRAAPPERKETSVAQQETPPVVAERGRAMSSRENRRMSEDELRAARAAATLKSPMPMEESAAEAVVTPAAKPARALSDVGPHDMPTEQSKPAALTRVEATSPDLASSASHPAATRHEIEALLDERLAVLRSWLLQDLMLAYGVHDDDGDKTVLPR